MPDGGIQLYEAIVVDSQPDGEPPGHILVQIPELFGDGIDVPVSIAPLFPGWFAGGWQSVPSVISPDEDEENVRVVVVHLARNTFRWMGTSQAYDFITDNPGTRAGARSGDGRHAIYMDDAGGVYIEAGSDNNDGPVNFLSIAPDDTILMQTSDGSLVQLTPTQAVLMDATGDVLELADGTITMMQRDGVSYLSLQDGDVSVLGGTVVQINGGTIELGGGVSSPGDAYILSSSFLSDLSSVCSDIIAIGAAIPSMTPYVATNAATMLANIATSLGAGAPYLSTRIFGD